MRRISWVVASTVATLALLRISCGGDGANSGSDAANDTLIAPDANAIDSGDAAPPSPCGTSGDRLLSPEEAFPDSFLVQNGGRVYNVQSPPTTNQTAAKGDGQTDDTAALQDAWDYIKNAYVAAGAYQTPGYDFDSANFWIYLPHGTYLVSDTIIYRGGTLETDSKDYVWNDVVNVRFVGENRSTTTIRLADGAAGFADPKNPKIVLPLQHPDTVFNNIPTNNVVRNLTIDTGNKNPGAVALMFQAANLSSMHDVTLRSSDGQGAYGLWFKTGSGQGYYRDLTIEGFADGVYESVSGEMNPALEHLSINGVSHAAIHSIAGGLTVRALCSDQRMTAAQGVVIEKTSSQVVVLDSVFLGSSGTAMTMAQTNEESLFVRSVTTPGYTQAIARADAGGVSGTTVVEWSADTPIALVDGGATTTLNLPIEDTPIAAWGDPTKDWADPSDFGAKGDGTTDDTTAIQSALSSGKSVVVFPKAKYKLSKSLDVPATVLRIDGMWADLGSPAFAVNAVATTPITISETPGYGAITLSVARDVVSKERSGDFRNAQTAPVKVYLENAVNLGGTPQFCPTGQRTWARAIDTEQPSGTDFLVSGGTMWIFAYKTENKPCISLRVADGGSAEVFNGYVNSTNAPGATPMIVNDRSTMSFIGFTNLGGKQWTTAIEEIGSTSVIDVDASTLPARDNSNFFIPLYVGHAE